MDIITRTNHGSSYWPGVILFFGRHYKEGEHTFRKFMRVRKSTKAEEKIVEHKPFGLAQQRDEAAPVKIDSTGEGAIFRTSHIGYGLGYRITKEALDDNLYSGMIPELTGKLMQSARLTQEYLGHLPINRSFDANYKVGNTGVQLCTDNHPSDAGNQSNILPAATDISERGLETMLTQIALAVDSRGNPISIEPHTLLVNTANRFEVSRLINSSLQPNSDSNNINALRQEGVIPKVVRTRYTQDPDAWWVLCDTESAPAMIFWERTALEVNEHTPDGIRAIDTDVYFRCSAQPVDFRGIYGSEGH